ncbi:hypothetical protein FFWV33_00285 [Flavobacterium faecale]|uniref:Uncharacterized protein n=1 Tax=Flavobacterium faecale TaxID=1355330 RepID=A0A2S1LIF9_9FLAO|nr:hypothetical protein [Flavobacterium faecale]AWG23519.1 hypothetical protein FFWV33_00285 [Flavobacterium faecale]
MQYFFQKTVLLFSIFLLVSCNFVETIDIQENGSGEFALEVDASGLLAMGGGKIGEKMGMKENQKVLDSTITFKSIFESKKDSIANLSTEEQAALKRMENTVLHMKMDPDKQEFLIAMNSPFSKIAELQNLMEGFSVLKDLKKTKSSSTDKSPFGGSFGDNNSKLSFSYDGKTFNRNVEMVKENQVAKDSTGMSKMLFASSSYTLKYHFPKPVKSVSNPDALFSGDRKTITVRYPFAEYMENPEKLNLNVVFE